jgi:hypothetical protein
MADTEFDALVPDPQFFAECGITPMTGWRHDRSEKMAELGWPPKVNVNGRNYRFRSAIEAFKTNLKQRALAKRGATNLKQRALAKRGGK